MGIRSLVSFGLFVLPVAVTLSIILAVDLPRRSNGQQSIFAPPINNKVTTDEFCQLAYGFTPDPGRFTFNPNQWGVALLDPNDDGNLCMNVTYRENGTYPTNATSPTFTATWEYPQGPESQPVHAFPNAMIEIPEILNTTTVQISNVSSIPVNLIWSYGTGSEVADSTDGPVLVDAELNANVCFDMFLDTDPKLAVKTNASTYEVMIWFGAYGLSTQPIGKLQGIKATKTIDNTIFDLYGGQNSNTGQKVFTWVTQGNTTDFHGDIGSLLTDLETYGGPTGDTHLGYMAFGTEALYTKKEVTFSYPSSVWTSSVVEDRQHRSRPSCFAARHRQGSRTRMLETWMHCDVLHHVWQELSARSDQPTIIPDAYIFSKRDAEKATSFHNLDSDIQNFHIE